MNVEQQLRQKEFDVQKLQGELAEKESDIAHLTETFEREYEALSLENESNVHELHKTFKDSLNTCKLL